MLETFKDLEDRYETSLEYDSNDVVVSIDKNEVSDLTETILAYVNTNLETIISDTLSFIDDNKRSYEIAHINDLSDPQIIINSNCFSVYWYSEKGEIEGNAVIGIDYSWPPVIQQGLTIGD